MRGALIAALTALLAVASGVAPTVASPTVAADPPPNIVLVLTDDQRWDSLWAMPIVRHQIAARGTTFTNAFVENPLCCPSRTSILTGAFSHSTGIYQNAPPHGGFQDFQDASTVATWLQGAGYRTGLIGKYLNGYTITNGHYVPPGWSRWVAHSGGGEYFNYTLSIDGTNVIFGGDEADYSTDVFGTYARDFITDTPDGVPLFLYFAPHAPHGLTDGPPIPAPRDAGTFSHLVPWRPPSYNEADISDKPAWMQEHPLWTRHMQKTVDQFRIGQLESLLAVDDAVGTILDALTAAGRMGNTLFVFSSDNGYLWGEHRLTEKNVPYEESIRVPMVVRFDAVEDTPGAIDPRFVLNADLAPTFADAAGISAPGVEGTSFLPLLSSEVGWRRDFLVEHAGATASPFCQVRSTNATYILYSTGEEELYDLALDPYQLVNRAADPGYASTLAELRARERRLCVPLPPGFPD